MIDFCFVPDFCPLLPTRRREFIIQGGRIILGIEQVFKVVESDAVRSVTGFFTFGAGFTIGQQAKKEQTGGEVYKILHDKGLCTVKVST